MELEQLKEIWLEQDGEIDKVDTVNLGLLKEASVGKVKSLLSDFKWTTIFELAVTVIGVNYLLGYLADVATELKYLVPGIMLLLLGIYDIVWKIMVLNTYSRISYHDSITETQKRVEKLKYFERREINELYLVIPIFWMAFVVVLAHGLLGIDAYQFLQYNWPYQLVGSVVIAILVVWFVKLFPDKKLNEAVAFLKQIEDFESDEE